jgi:crotonobetainyl-CoA:carnitine CoA-transferase CaiB-like acyl-CoA transferase
VAALGDLKVVEFGAFAAGPAVGKHLADHGAEVIHVESRQRLDGFRTNYPPFAEGEPGVEGAAMFAITNSNKLSVELNLKTEAGRDLARRLGARADVVIENMTLGAMERLGLGYDALAAVNPGLVMLSSCNQGQTGPHAARVGFGTHLTAMVGFTHLTGWPDRSPSLLWGPYIDYIAVAYGVVAVLAALDARGQTGAGCHIDLSQYETGLQFMSPAVIDHAASGRTPTRAGNRDLVAVPHGIYPCLGEERWCAVSVHDDAEWMRLRGVIGDPDWCRQPALAHADGRRAHEDEIDDRLAEWTASSDRDDLVARLRAVEVHCAPVNDMADLHTDPQLRSRQAFRAVEHPVIGTYSAQGPPYLLSETPAVIDRPAPLLGQHNYEVFIGLLGLDSSEYGRLAGEGAFD